MLAFVAIGLVVLVLARYVAPLLERRREWPESPRHEPLELPRGRSPRLGSEHRHV